MDYFQKEKLFTSMAIDIEKELGISKVKLIVTESELLIIDQAVNNETQQKFFALYDKIFK